MAEKHIKKYPNGATLIYYNQNINSTTDVTMGFLSGANFDGKKHGLAHAVEHSILLNNISGMTEQELYALLRKTGTRHNAFTNNEVIATTFNTPNNHFEEIFKLDCQMFLKRDFTETRWRKERKAILQELYMTLDEEGISSLEANRRSKTKDKILGTPYTLNKITAQDLADYAEKRFITDNMVISIVSSLPYNQVKKIVEDNFINKFPSDKRKKVNLNIESYDLEDDFQTIDQPYANSFDIEFLFKGLDGVEKNDLMLRFENWYFNDFAGKLHQNLRFGNQLVYTSSFISQPVLNSNLKAFEIKTSPENANKCVEVLTKILRDAIKEGISEEDFELFKQTMLAKRARKTNIKTYESQKLFFDYIYGKKPFVRNFFNKLMNLKREDVNNYLKKVYGKSCLAVTYVGDMAKAQNIKFTNKNGILYPIDTTYPINVVSDEQIVRDYLATKPLYTFDDILDMYKYWDEVQLERLKFERDSEYLTSYALQKKKNFKLPKVNQSQIKKAIYQTVLNKDSHDDQKKYKEEQTTENLELKK